MPTSIATLGRERTIATLARRLYQFEGRGTNEAQRRAQAALIAANPRLSTTNGFRAGDQIVVPAVTGLKRTGNVRTSAADGEGLTNETSFRLQALGSQLEDSFHRASDRRQKTVKRLGDRRFVAEARTALRQSVEHITGARDRLRREEEEAEEVRARLRNAVSDALEGVKELDTLARKAGLGG